MIRESLLHKAKVENDLEYDLIGNFCFMKPKWKIIYDMIRESPLHKAIVVNNLEYDQGISAS